MKAGFGRRVDGGAQAVDVLGRRVGPARVPALVVGVQRRVVLGQPAQEVLAHAGAQVQRKHAEDVATGTAHGRGHFGQLVLAVAQPRQHGSDQRAGPDPGC